MLIGGLVIVLAAPLAAQQGMTRVDSAQRSQIQLFEAVLQRAVLQAGERLAAMARQVTPNVLLATNGDARARGLQVASSGVFEPDSDPREHVFARIARVDHGRSLPSPRRPR